jgi:hypothetical protein
MLQYFDTHLMEFFQVHFVVGGVLTKISITIILYKELTIEKPQFTTRPFLSVYRNSKFPFPHHHSARTGIGCPLQHLLVSVGFAQAPLHPMLWCSEGRSSRCRGGSALHGSRGLHMFWNPRWDYYWYPTPLQLYILLLIASVLKPKVRLLLIPHPSPALYFTADWDFWKKGHTRIKILKFGLPWEDKLALNLCQF